MSAKSLTTLMRLRDFEVDERRRRLGDLQRLVASLEQQIELLKQELTREQRIAADAPTLAGFMYGNYVRTVIARRAWIEESIARAEDEAAAARDELRDAYLELKKVGQIKENQDRREAEDLSRLEQGILDEVALGMYRRRE